MLLLLALGQSGCVTQTERIPYHRYYDPPENESVFDELRREFGWQKPPPWVQEEPFYKHAARSVRETLTGWLPKDEPANALTGGFQSMDELRRAQREAMDRLQQQQPAEESPLENRSGEGTDAVSSPGVGEAGREE
jgi:hypothetical protein